VAISFDAAGIILQAMAPRIAPSYILADFPAPNGQVERLSFTAPLEVIVADTIAAVCPALERVAQRTAEGCWAAGYVAYDAAPAFDAALHVAGRAPTPLLWFGIYSAPDRAPYGAVTHDSAAGEWQPHVSRAEYGEAIDDIRERVAEGAFYQANYTVRLRSAWTADALVAYESLRAAQPSSYAMYLDIGRFKILTVSPELFFTRTGRDIVTQPMKGTARRGRWPAEDAAAAATLSASTKDRAENVMIVDLLRNDLGRIAELGTVNVARLFDVERHPTIWQMTSTVRARLRAEATLPGIFAALFPSGSVVGAPKIAAAAWIAEHERAPRGVYCGAIGIVRPGGDCTFNVAIRTLVLDGETGTAEYGAGGGITADSTSAGEYDELLAKAAVLRGAPPEFELIETMRLSDGAYSRRARHVRRVCASAAYFDFADPASAVGRALDERTRASPSGDHRVRLLVARSGTARTEAAPIAPLSAPPPTWRYGLSATPVSSRDVFLFHKTTRRQMYEQQRAAHPAADEVILVNERGEITECTIGNLVVQIGSERFTPPLDCGLLAGVFRDELLERGRVTERVLYPADLSVATGVWLVNSLREWVALAPA
jgi:para-aminobenzoate synthetase/4-amino-4-deoxychorismate lyase